MRMMVKAPITCVGAILLLIFYTPRQAPVMIGIILPVSLLILGNMKIGYPRLGTVQKGLERLNHVTRQFLSSVRVVKAFSAEQEEADKFEDASLGLAAANVSALRTMAVFSPFINLLVNLEIVVLLWLSRSQEGAEIGKLMASVNYMTQVLFAVTMISNILNIAVRAMASSQRIREVLEEQPAQSRSEKPLRPTIKGELCFQNVSFIYAGLERKALRTLAFYISPGETIGIIGPIGSGKTTLVNLVPRFYDATEGKVFIDGRDVAAIDETLLRTAIAVVPQKALLQLPVQMFLLNRLRKALDKKNMNLIRSL